MSTLHLRPAVEKDIPAFVKIYVEAFHDTAFHQAAFPKHLREKPGLEDQIEWGIRRSLRDLNKPSMHYIVVVDQAADGDETVVGCAEWVGPSVAEEVEDKATEAEKAKAHKERMASLPLFFDKDAIAAGAEEIKELLDAVKPSLGDKKMSNMWSKSKAVRIAKVDALISRTASDDSIILALNSIAVDDKYRGRGIGKMLTRWGIDMAEERGEDIWLIASPHGLSMYQSLGFKEIGEGTRFGERQVFMTKFIDAK